MKIYGPKDIPAPLSRLSHVDLHLGLTYERLKLDFTSLNCVVFGM